MKKILTIVFVFLLHMNIAYAATAESSIKPHNFQFSYYKIGVQWDVDGITLGVNERAKDIHFDGKVQDICSLLGTSDIKFNKKLSFSFLSVTIIFQMSHEPIEHQLAYI